MASGGVVPKVVHFGVLRRLVLKLEAIFQNFISLSIQGVRSSFFVQIEAKVKEMSHKKLILKIVSLPILGTSTWLPTPSLEL